MDGHLVPIEIGIEWQADQWVQPDRFVVGQHGLERLQAIAVDGRCPIEEHDLPFDDLRQGTFRFRVAGRGQRGRRGVVRGRAVLDQPVDDEGPEELSGHSSGQTALGELQIGAGSDHRPSGEIDTFADGTQTSVHSPDQITERGDGGPAIVGADLGALHAVPEEHLCGLLNALCLLLHDDLRSAFVNGSLASLVPGGEPGVEFVETPGEQGPVRLAGRHAVGRGNDGDHSQQETVRGAPGLHESLEQLVRSGGKAFLGFLKVDAGEGSREGRSARPELLGLGPSPEEFLGFHGRQGLPGPIRQLYEGPPVVSHLLE